MFNRKAHGKNANKKKCKYCQFITMAKIKNGLDNYSNATCTNEKSRYYKSYINANSTCAKFEKVPQ